MRQIFATVLVVPDVLLREGLARILSATPFRMLSSAASMDESSLSRLSQHQSVLLVICPGDDPDATAMQIALFKEKQQSGRVAVLAERYQLSDVLTAFRAGANAYFVKVTTCAAFIKALELVMLGETIVPREVLPFILAHKDEAIHKDEATSHGLKTRRKGRILSPCRYSSMSRTLPTRSDEGSILSMPRGIEPHRTPRLRAWRAFRGKPRSSACSAIRSHSSERRRHSSGVGENAACG